MKRILITILTIGTLGFANAQNQETRNLDSFSELSVGESIKVNLKKGNENKAVIETSGVDTEQVLTEISGDRLRIHMRKGSWFRTNVEIVLTYNGTLEDIEVSSSAKVIGESVIEANEMDIRVSSSGRLEVDVKAEEIDINVSSSGKAVLTVDSKRVDAKINSSGKVEVSGNTDFQEFNISSSGRLLAYNLKSKKVRANISSSGNAEISVSEELIADASSSGRINYKGNPEKVIIDSSSSGKVKRAD